MSTSRIIHAFILIQTVRLCRIQFKTSGTDATEAAESVNTFARFGTEPTLFGALVNVLALVSYLVVTFWACALVTALRVDALVLADMAADGAFVYIATCGAIWVEDVPSRTRTNEASGCVLTGMLARRRCMLTFIYI